MHTCPRGISKLGRQWPVPMRFAATSAKEIATAVDFARKHDVRIAVKGTGHDYLGRNLAPDSLLIWTHNMRKIEVLDSFVPAGAPAGALGDGSNHCWGRYALAGGL